MPGARDVDVCAAAVARRQHELIVDGAALGRIAGPRIAVVESGLLEQVPGHGGSVAFAAQLQTAVVAMPGHSEGVPVHRLRGVSVRLARDDEIADREPAFAECRPVRAFLAEPVADRGVNPRIEVVGVGVGRRNQQRATALLDAADIAAHQRRFRIVLGSVSADVPVFPQGVECA
jgi:hypothetical protein